MQDSHSLTVKCGLDILRLGENCAMSVKLISKCGIYCGACYVYRAFKDGGKLLEITAEKLGVPKEEIRCNGCLGSVEDIWRMCKKCQFRDCLRERGLAFCYECPEFENSTCAKYESAREFTSKRGENIREALERIKAGDADRWLMEQDERWRCTTCSGSIYWTEKICHHCGKPIHQV